MKRSLDDVWRVDDVLATLKLSNRLMNVLCRYFEERGIVELTLRQFMDLVLHASNCAPVCLAFYNVRGMGKIAHKELCLRMSVEPFGEEFHKEWIRRLCISGSPRDDVLMPAIWAAVIEPMKNRWLREDPDE